MRYSRYQIVASLAIALGYILIASSPSAAQGSSARYFPEPQNKDVRKVRCSPNLSQAPELRGFRLGMTQAQVLARFPRLQIDEARTFPGTKAEFQPGLLPGFESVRTVRLWFFDERIFYIEVIYDGSTQWNTVDEFVAKVSEALNLPNDWQSNRTEQFPECAGYRMIAKVEFIGLSPKEGFTQATLILEDGTADKRMENRLKEDEEKERRADEERRKVFKP